MIYLILALGLMVLVCVSTKVGWRVRRVGVVRFLRALGILIANVIAAGIKLVGGSTKPSVSQSKPLDLSGTGGRYNARTGNYDNGQDPYGTYPNDDHRF